MLHFTRNNERESLTGFTGTTCTTYAVCVAFRILRHIIVIYVRYARNIKTSSCHICSHENIDGPFAKLANYAVPFLLRQIAMDAFRHVTTFLKTFCYFINTTFRTCEDNSKFRCLDIKQTAKNIKFLTVLNFDIVLFNQVHRHLSRFHANQGRLCQIRFSQLLNGFRHRSREQQGLMVFRDCP